MKLLFALFLTITACGPDNGGGAGKADLVADSGAPADDADETNVDAMLVATAADMPACDEKAEGRIVYVKDEAMLKACIGLAWQAVDLKGSDGKDGVAGKDGKDGQDGAEGTPAPANSWLDPMTDSVWLVAGMQSSSMSIEQASTLNGTPLPCTGKWHLPSDDELDAAKIHGLWLGVLPFGADECAHVDDAADWTRPVNATTSAATCDTVPRQVGILCVSN